jgi:glycosyltransferase involved in cell wall biosynthesis
MQDYGLKFVIAETFNPPQGRNLAASEATGEYLVFLDDHVLLTGDWFEQAGAGQRHASRSL